MKIHSSLSFYARSYLKLIALGFLGMLLTVSCSGPTHVTPAELNALINGDDSELVRTYESDGYSIRLSYQPNDLWILREGEGLVMDSSTYASLNKKYSDNYYFILSLSKNKREALNPAETGTAGYSALLENLSFKMDRHVGLITSSGDTIRVRDFMLDRTYGLGHATNVLFSFSREKCKEQDWLEFKMAEFGLGIGEQRFRFKTKDLESIPRLEFVIEPNTAI